MTKRYTAAHIIAEYLCWDINDVTDMIYQPTEFKSPYVYGISVRNTDGPDYEYLCCPSGRQKPPRDRDHPDRWEWHEVWTSNGRKVYASTDGSERM